MGETDHETVYKCLIVQGKRELGKGEVIKVNGQGSASNWKNLAQVMNLSYHRLHVPQPETHCGKSFMGDLVLSLMKDPAYCNKYY